MARARSPREVNCTRCGRGNPEHVRYCLDCGSELSLGKVRQRGAPQVAPDTAHVIGRTARSTTSRPPAPDLNFGAQREESLGLGLAALSLSGGDQPKSGERGRAPQGDAHQDTKATSCSACGTANPEGSSFCCECGAALQVRKKERPLGRTIAALGGNASPIEAPSLATGVHGSVASAEGHDAGQERELRSELPSTSTAAPNTERAFKNLGAAASPEALSPEPVNLDPRPSLRVLPPFKNCPRCEGANSPEARFCQLCGIPLGQEPAEDAPRPDGPEPEPSAQALPSAWLVVIGQDGTPGRRYPLRATSLDIGRENGDIRLEKDPYVCPRHARLTYGSRGFSIEDLGSVNGVFVRLGASPVELRHGDLLLLGQAVLRFEIVEETERSISPAIRDSTRVFGSPAVPRRARLVLQTVEGCGRDIFYLSRAETILGREAGDIVFTDDPFMSRRHGALRRASATNTYTLRDLGSSNGTFIAIRRQQPLSSGDHVRIGQHLFRLDVQSGGSS